jgi:hypothetical protein
MAETTLTQGAAEAIAGGWHSDPFAVLGLQKAAMGWEVRAFIPGAHRLWVLSGKSEAEAIPFPGVPGLFTHQIPRGRPWNGLGI